MSALSLADGVIELCAFIDSQSFAMIRHARRLPFRMTKFESLSVTLHNSIRFFWHPPVHCIFLTINLPVKGAQEGFSSLLELLRCIWAPSLGRRCFVHSAQRASNRSQPTPSKRFLVMVYQSLSPTEYHDPYNGSHILLHVHQFLAVGWM